MEYRNKKSVTRAIKMSRGTLARIREYSERVGEPVATCMRDLIEDGLRRDFEARAREVVERASRFDAEQHRLAGTEKAEARV